MIKSLFSLLCLDDVQSKAAECLIIVIKAFTSCIYPKRIQTFYDLRSSQPVLIICLLQENLCEAQQLHLLFVLPCHSALSSLYYTGIVFQLMSIIHEVLYHKKDLLKFFPA